MADLESHHALALLGALPTPDGTDRDEMPEPHLGHQNVPCEACERLKLELAEERRNNTGQFGDK